MHASSLAKMASFFRTYADQFPRENGVCKLLEVGSKTYRGQPNYRELIDKEWIRYTGLDLEAGENVDLVPERGYVWPELKSDSFGVCISGQTFEHNPFFWVTMAEISRVLVPGGIACIIAPGAQGVHRFPVDCWRFFPDSWAALCALTGLELLEVYFETDKMALSVIDGEIRDSMVIARKPQVTSEQTSARLKQITEPFTHGNVDFTPVMQKEGPCIADYRRTAPRTKKVRARVMQLILPTTFFDPGD
jgi:SAM-dependent methyltransferase